MLTLRLSRRIKHRIRTLFVDNLTREQLNFRRFVKALYFTMALKINFMLFVGLAFLTIAVAVDYRLYKPGLTVLVKVMTGGYRGYKGEALRPTTCLDYLRQGASKSGIYTLYINGGKKSYPAYCDLTSERGIAWTLVMSWSTQNRKRPPFKSIPFKFNSPVNEDAQNWKQYRLSLARMKSLQSHSTHWRATCSFPEYRVRDFRDYVRGNFKEFNIVDFLGVGQCKKVEYINIRGNVGTNLTARFWQIVNSDTLHIDSSNTGCQFDPTPGSLSNEDNFGLYIKINPKFRCTEKAQSTTQWWFGGHL